MALFKCDNPNCNNNNVVKKIGTLKLHWDNEKERYVSYFKCDECESYLIGYREEPVKLKEVDSINKGATKVSSDKRNTIY